MPLEDCEISWWDRANDRVVSIGYYPPLPAGEPMPLFDISDYPMTKHVLEDQVVELVDAGDPTGDRAEVALLVKYGKQALVMLPLVASGESIGLVELMSEHAIELDDDRLSLVRTINNEAAIALENARLYEGARALADRDPLTGFFNHRYLHERFVQEAVRARRSHRPLSLLMLDLDDFKLVNDSFGHLLGDDVLRWTADLIRKTLRASDVPARYGGDEFALVLPETDDTAAQQVAARVSERLEKDVETPRIKASFGVAFFPRDGSTAEAILSGADRALYGMKAASRSSGGRAR